MSQEGMKLNMQKILGYLRKAIEHYNMIEDFCKETETTMDRRDFLKCTLTLAALAPLARLSAKESAAGMAVRKLWAMRPLS